MKGKDTLRNAHRALAAREAGLPAGQERIFAGQVVRAGQETRALRLPVIPAAGEIQNEDGTFVFILDLSALDGEDVLA